MKTKYAAIVDKIVDVVDLTADDEKALVRRDRGLQEDGNVLMRTSESENLLSAGFSPKNRRQSRTIFGGNGRKRVNSETAQMAGSKEIRNKIKSVQSTRKITKAMEMVAASKMKKAQDRMRATRPYMEKVFNIVMHIAKANTEYRHPFLVPRETVKRVGAIVVTTDKGLCGGLNTNVLRQVLQAHKDWKAKGIEVDYVAIGGKGLGFLQRMGGNVVRQRRAARRPSAPRPPRGAGQDAASTIPRRQGRRGARVLHDLHQHDEAGTAPRPHHPDSAPVQDGRGRSAHRREISDGTWDYIYEPRCARAARRHDAPLPRGHRRSRWSTRTCRPSNRRAWWR